MKCDPFIDLLRSVARHYSFTELLNIEAMSDEIKSLTGISKKLARPIVLAAIKIKLKKYQTIIMH